MLAPISQVIDPNRIPTHCLVYICHESAKYCASQVSGRELCCNVRGRELDNDFLPSNPLSVSQAKGCINAIHGFPVVDVREKESWNGFGGEIESNMDAILPGNGEEWMTLKLATRDVLD